MYEIHIYIYISIIFYSKKFEKEGIKCYNMNGGIMHNIHRR